MPKTDWALTPEKNRRKACEAPFSPRSGTLSETRPMGGNTEVMIKQPETCPITQEQFVAEVRRVFAGLVMVESKCIELITPKTLLAKVNRTSEPTTSSGKPFTAYSGLHTWPTAQNHFI